MIGLNAGTAYVKVKPDLRDIHRDIRRGLVDVDKEFQALSRRLRAEVSKGLTDGVRSSVPTMGQQGRSAASAFTGAFDREVRTKIRKALDSMPPVKIGAATNEAEQKIRDLRAELGRISNQRIGIDVDAASATAAVNRIQGELDQLSRSSADVQVRTDVAAAAAALATVERARERLDGKNATIEIKTRGAAQAAGLLSQTSLTMGQMLAGSVALGSTMIPVLAAGAVGAAGLASALGAAGLAMGAFGAVAAVSLKNAMEGQEELKAATESRVQLVSTLRDAQRSQASAQQGLAQAQVAAADAITDAERGVADAHREVADAQRAVREAQRGVLEAERGVVAARQDAARASQDAQQAIVDAERNLVDSQEAVRSSLADLHLARQQAKQDLDDLRERTRDQALTEEGAAISLARARQELRRTERDDTASALDLREARLRVAEAEDRLGDVRRDGRRNAQELAEAERRGISGAEGVVAARQAVADARGTEADAERALTRARQDAIRVRQDGQRSIAQAQRGVADAERAVAEAQRGVGDAQRAVAVAERDLARARTSGAQQVAAAQQAVAQAQRQVASAQRELAKNDKARADAVSKMGPAAGIALAAVAALKREWAGFLGAVQPSVMRALAVGMGALGPLMDAMVPVVKAGAAVFADFARAAGRMFESPAFVGLMDWMARMTRQVGPMLGRVVLNLAMGFGQLLRAFAPVGKMMVRGLLDMSKGFRKWAAGLDESEGFKRFINYARDMMPKVIEFFRQLAGAGARLVEGLAPIGGVVLAAFTWIFRMIRKIPADVITALFGALVGGLIAFKGVMVAVNLVMRFNPIVAVVTALALLGAALYLAYKRSETFRKIVNNAWDKIKQGVSWAWRKVIRPALEAFAAYYTDVIWPALKRFWGWAKPLLAAFGQWIKRVWDRTIKPALKDFWVYLRDVVWPAIKKLWRDLKPVFAAIGRWIARTWTDTIKPALRAFGRFLRDVLWPALKWLWKNVVKPVFAAVGRIIVGAWNNVIKPVLKALWVYLRDVVFPWLRFLWREVIKPVFSAIGRIIRTWWNDVAKPVLKAVWVYLRDVLFPWLKFLWTKVVKPIFKLIGGAIKFQWENVIKPAFKAIWWVLKNVVFPVIKWLWYKVIKPYWGWISDKIRDAYNNVIKPTFKAIGDFIRNTLVPAFRRGVRVIGNIWDGLKRLAARPVNFVIDTVYNKGIRKFVNNLLDFFDAGNNGPRLPKVDKVKWGGGSSPSLTGNTGNPANPTILKTGGVLPGYTPGRDVHKFISPTGGELHLSGGEAVMRPEWTRAVGGPRAVDAMNREARGLHGPLPYRRRRRDRFAAGGLWHTPGTRSQHSKADYPGSIWSGDINVPGSGDRGNPVRAWKAGTVARAAMNGNDGSYGNVIEVNHPDDNVSTLYAHLMGIAVRAGQDVRRGQRIGRVGDTGNSSGPHLHFEINPGTGEIDLGSVLAGAARSGLFGAAGLLFSRLPDWVKAIPGKIGDLLGTVTKFGKGAGTWVTEIVGGAARRVIEAAKEFALEQLPSATAGLTQAKDFGSSAAGIWRSLMSTGYYSKRQAAGVMGNMVTESGLNPHIVQGGGSKPLPIGVSSGWGLVQWTPGTKVLPYLNGDGSVASQVSALTAQLRGRGPSPEGYAGRKLRATRTVDAATWAFGKYYERPADLGSTIAQRRDDARRLYEAFAAMPAPGKVGRWGDRFRNRAMNPRRRAAGGVLPTLSDNGGWLQPGGMTFNALDKPEPVMTPEQWRTLRELIRSITKVTMNGGGAITPGWLTDVLSKVPKTAEQLRAEFLKLRDALKPAAIAVARHKRALDEIRESDRFKRADEKRDAAERAFKATRSRKEITEDIGETRGELERARTRAGRTPMGRDALREYREANRKLSKLREEDAVAEAQRRTRWRLREARARLRDEREPIRQAREEVRKGREDLEQADTKAEKQAARRRIRAARQELRTARQQPDSARKRQAREAIEAANRRLETLGKERDEIDKWQRQRDKAIRQSPAVAELDTTRKRLESLREERKERKRLGREYRRASNKDILKREEAAQERLTKATKRQADAQAAARKAAEAYRAAQEAALERARSIRETAMELGSIGAAEFKSSGGIVANLRNAIRTVREWGGIVRQLMARGLRGPILAEFVDAGPSAESVRTGKSLLAGTQIAEINALQDELARVSTHAAAVAVGNYKPKQRAEIRRAPRLPPHGMPIDNARQVRDRISVNYTGMPADTVESIVNRTVTRVKYELKRDGRV